MLAVDPERFYRLERRTHPRYRSAASTHTDRCHYLIQRKDRKGIAVQRGLCCLLLTGLMVIGISEARAAAQTKFEAYQPQSMKMKAAVANLGPWEAVQVRVALLDKSF